MTRVLIVGWPSFVDGEATAGDMLAMTAVRRELVEAGWLRDWDCDCALVPLDTRLDREDWRLCGTPAQVESIIRRLDLVVTTRMHGLVLALSNAVPALAVDPVAGGAKVSAQALAWTWPAVVRPDPRGRLDRDQLRYWRDWCLSPAGITAAARAARSPPPSSLGGLRQAMTAGLRG